MSKVLVTERQLKTVLGAVRSWSLGGYKTQGRWRLGRPEEEYQGIKIIAPSNVHEECLFVIEQLGLAPEAAALDLGAGEGAFSKRLMDRGFAVTAVEADANRFKAPTPCENVDLNRDFPNKWKEQFDLVVAIEIIEHLENPRHFIRECLAILKENKFLILTSPNVESWVSRLKFLRTGRPFWFDESDYESTGHITPIFSWQVVQICNELEAKLIRIVHTKNRFLLQKLGRESLAGLIRNRTFYGGILYPFMKNRKDGENNIFVIQK